MITDPFCCKGTQVSQFHTPGEPSHCSSTSFSATPLQLPSMSPAPTSSHAITVRFKPAGGGPLTISNRVRSNHAVMSEGWYLPPLCCAHAVTLVHCFHAFLSTSSPPFWVGI